MSELKEIRERKGITLSELAKDTGIDEEDLSHIEDGIFMTSYEEKERIASALGVAVREIEIPSCPSDEETKKFRFLCRHMKYLLEIYEREKNERR